MVASSRRKDLSNALCVSVISRPRGRSVGLCNGVSPWQCRANKAIERNQIREFGLARCLRSRRTHRQHDITQISIAVVDAHLDRVGKTQAKLTQNLARFTYRARAIGLADVSYT